MSYTYIHYPNSPNIYVHGAYVDDDGALISSGLNTIIMYGPYTKISDRRYSFTLNYEVVENSTNSPVVGTFDICADGNNVIKKSEILSNECHVTINDVVFDISKNSVFEHRVFDSNGAKIKIVSVKVGVEY